MDIRCANGWLFHEWRADGKCIRCPAIGFRGTQNAATSAGDLSLSVVPLRVHPAGLAARHDSHHHPADHLHLRVQRSHDEDDSASASSAKTPACSEGVLVRP